MQLSIPTNSTSNTHAGRNLRWRFRVSTVSRQAVVLVLLMFALATTASAASPINSLAFYSLAPLQTGTPKSKLDAEEEEAPPKKPSTPPPKSKLDSEEEEAPPKKPSTSTPPKAPSGSGVKPPGVTPPNGDGGPPLSESDLELAVCDTAFLDDRPVRIRLFPDYVPFPLPQAQKGRDFVLSMFISNEAGAAIKRVSGKDLKFRIVYYEERMWKRAAETLSVTPEKLAEPGAVFDLASPNMTKKLDHAEKLIITALAEHDSAVQQNRRVGPDWEPQFRRPLLQALLNIKLSRVDQLIRQGQTSEGISACDALLAEFKGSGLPTDLLRARFETIFLGQARERMGSEEYAGARAVLDELAARYPRETGGAVRKLREELIIRAKLLIDQATVQKAAKKDRDALATLEKAADVWPELPELEVIRRLMSDYKMLACAYPELPVNLSPLLARTAVERHAGALLFESLVRWSDDPLMGPHYECQLARGRPIPLARGRQFQLPLCRWSDSTEEDPHLCTVEDVRWTAMKLLANRKLPGHLPAWARLIKEVDSTSDNDPFTAAIRLSSDHWQPLSLMDFMVLPRTSFPESGTEAELDRFNKQPIGTGPYKLESSETDQVRFVANPHYRTPGLPKIREITFHQLTPVKAVDEFLAGRIQLIYGMTPEHVNQVRQQQPQAVKTLRTPSVWFLAPNYRQKQLTNPDLRLAIAHAIDREAILNQYFRPGRNSSDHAALTGPYPQSSWAYNPSTPKYDTNKASAFAEKARTAFQGNLTPLRLMYPANDVPTEEACKQIQSDVAKVGITLDLKPIPPQRFHAHIVDSHDFDLAYWRHDFQDETYWLWPLFDPDGMGKGGANFMGVPADQDLLPLFQNTDAHKRFPEIQSLTHKIHDHVARTAAIVPLWQLDTYVAVHSSLRDATLDPVSLFGNVERWSIVPKAK